MFSLDSSGKTCSAFFVFVVIGLKQLVPHVAVRLAVKIMGKDLYAFFAKFRVACLECRAGVGLALAFAK